MGAYLMGSSQDILEKFPFGRLSEAKDSSQMGLNPKLS